MAPDDVESFRGSAKLEPGALLRVLLLKAGRLACQQFDRSPITCCQLVGGGEP